LITAIKMAAYSKDYHPSGFNSLHSLICRTVKVKKWCVERSWTQKHFPSRTNHEKTRAQRNAGLHHSSHQMQEKLLYHGYKSSLQKTKGSNPHRKCITAHTHYLFKIHKKLGYISQPTVHKRKEIANVKNKK